MLVREQRAHEVTLVAGHVGDSKSDSKWVRRGLIYLT